MKKIIKAKWKNRDVAKYKGRIYDIVLYDGIFPDRKGQFKFMERTDMFNSHDFYLNDLPAEERRKIKKLKS